MIPHWMLILSVLAFFVLLIYIGHVTSKWISSSSDFFVSGREVSLFINACAIGGIGFAASLVAALPQFSITLGFWPSVFYGMMWATSVILFGITIGGFIRRTGTYTISEWMGMRLSTKTRVICAACQVLGTVSVMAANIAGISVILEPMTGYPYIVNVIAITAGFLLYTILGGMWAVTIVDVAHIVIGLPIYYLVCSKLLMQTDFLANLPDSSWRLFSLTGHLPIFNLTFPSAITFVLSWMLFVFGSQYYWIRLTSARSERGAIGGCVWGGLGGVLLLIAPMSLIGLFATTLVPGKWAPNQAWGQLVGNALPAVFAVWMVIAVLGASMSTASTALMGTSSTVLRDFYQRFINPKATPKELVMPSRIAVFFAGVLTCLLAVFYPGGAAWLLAAAGAWFGTPAIILILSIYWRKITPTGSFWGIVTGLVVTVAWQFTPYWKTVAHMVVIAIIVTLVVTVIVSLVTQSEIQRQTNSVKLSDYHFQILRLLQKGRNTLDTIVDGLKIDGERIFKYLNELCDADYISAKGQTGLAQLTFTLNPKGVALLPQLSEVEQQMFNHGITLADLKVLLAVSRNSKLKTEELSDNTGILREDINQHINHLVRQGYVVEYGLWRRFVRLSSQGKSLINDNSLPMAT